MPTKLFSFGLRLLVALAAAQVASGYVFLTPGSGNGQPERWAPGTILMHVQLGTQVTPSNGSNVSAEFVTAMQNWNTRLTTVQFSWLVEAPAPGTYHDGVFPAPNGPNKNEVYFDSLIYGQTFSNGTLAVTTGWTSGNQRVEADMIFNTAYGWDSYTTARASNSAPYDIMRVALHELGHVLGLDHPDTANPPQGQAAIMRSIVSTINNLQPDDILGAQNLYGGLGASAPANDNFANAIPIQLAFDTNLFRATGSNIYPNAATRQAGEPLIINNAGGHSVWWRWVAPANGPFTIDTRGSMFDTTLGVYTGSAVNALTKIAENDDEPIDPLLPHINTSLVTFNAVAGTTYYIAVDGYYDATYLFGEVGLITLNVTNVGSSSTPGFASNPANTSVSAGQNAQFTVAVTGNFAPYLQWERLPAAQGSTWIPLTNGGGFSGVTTPTLTISATTVGMSGDRFHCIAANTAGTVTSNLALLTVTTASIAARGDLNGDRKSDILFTNTATGERAVWLMNGTTISAGVSLGILSPNWVFSATGDFNGDGMIDIFLTYTVTGERAVWLMNGTTVATGASLGILPTTYAISGVGDFNADGKDDIVLTNTATGDRAVWLMNGTSILAGAFIGVLPTDWQISGIGDFNADGKADIVLTQASTGVRAAWLMNGTTVAAGAYIGILPTDWSFSGIGDFNGDGKSDVVLTNTATGDRAVWLMNGTSVTAGAYIGVLPTNWVFSQIGDFNGDGKADIFLTDTTTGERAIWLMNGTTITSGASLGVLSTNWLIRN